jgi:hypothetical protein
MPFDEWSMTDTVTPCQPPPNRPESVDFGRLGVGLTLRTVVKYAAPMTISRQRHWQIKRLDSGKCQLCGKRKLFTATHCRTCRNLHNARRRKPVVDKTQKLD